MALTQVTSAGLLDSTIVGGDISEATISAAKLINNTLTDTQINASAAIALSKLASTGALGSAITATTQSASDNSTKLATTAYVQTAVTNLIGGAPGALDTLNELAAAINDDSSYASTVTTALATKAVLTGSTNNTICTVTGANAIQGEANLTFDGSNLNVVDGGAIIGGGSDNDVLVRLDHEDNTGKAELQLNSWGSASISLISNFSGSTVSGIPTGAFGLITPHAKDIIFSTSGIERLRITSGGCVYASNFGFGTDSNWKIRPNTSSTELAFEYATSSTLADTNIKMFLNPSGRLNIKTVPAAVGGTMGDYGIMFQASTTPTDGQVIQGITFNPHDTAVGRARAGIAALANANGGSHPQSGADLVFMTRYSADGHDLDVAADERLRIDSSGHLLHGVTSDENTSGNGGLRFINAGDIQIDGDQKALVFRSANSTAQVQSGIEWWNENGAGVQAKIICDRTAIQKAPSDIVFFTNTDVDTSANNSEGDVTEHFRITSVGKVQRRSLGTQTNPALSAQHLYENGITTDGNYYLQSSSMTAPALVRCVFHDDRGWMILMQHQCVDCDGLYLSHLENKVGTPNHATSDFQGCAQTDGLNLTPMNMWDAFGPNAEDSRMAMYAREIQTSGGSYDETQTYSGYVGNPIFNQVSFKRLFSGNFSNGTFEYSIRVTHNDGATTVYSKKGTTWSSPSLATINNGVVDEDLYFCNGADDGDTNWSFGLMQGGTPYPRLANSANGGGRNSITRWAIIGICEK